MENRTDTRSCQRNISQFESLGLVLLCLPLCMLGSCLSSQLLQCLFLQPCNLVQKYDRRCCSRKFSSVGGEHLETKRAEFRRRSKPCRLLLFLTHCTSASLCSVVNFRILLKQSGFCTIHSEVYHATEMSCSERRIAYLRCEQHFAVLRTNLSL